MTEPDPRYEQFLSDFDDDRVTDTVRLNVFRQEVRDAREDAVRILRGLDPIHWHANKLITDLLKQAGHKKSITSVPKQFWSRLVLATDTVLVVLAGERMTVLGYEAGVVEVNIESFMRDLLTHSMIHHNWDVVNPIKEEWRKPPEDHATGMCRNPKCTGTDCADPRVYVFSTNTESYRGQVAVVRYWTPDFESKISINGEGVSTSDIRKKSIELFGEDGPKMIQYAIHALGGRDI